MNGEKSFQKSSQKYGYVKKKRKKKEQRSDLTKS